MKDGRTHLAHKAEHAVDLETGAVVGVTIQGADTGDTTTMVETVIAAAEQVEAVLPTEPGMAEVVADKGCHSNETMVDLAAVGVRSYIAEPDRGRRCWKGAPAARDAVYANRRRIRGNRGRELLRRRGELLERPFAHLYDTGGMRAGAPAGAFEHSETGAGPCRGWQPRAASASSDRRRHAPWPPGAGRVGCMGADQTVGRPVGRSRAGLGAVSARFAVHNLATALSGLPALHLNTEDFCHGLLRVEPRLLQSGLVDVPKSLVDKARRHFWEVLRSKSRRPIAHGRNHLPCRTLRRPQLLRVRGRTPGLPRGGDEQRSLPRRARLPRRHTAVGLISGIRLTSGAARSGASQAGRSLVLYSGRHRATRQVENSRVAWWREFVTWPGRFAEGDPVVVVIERDEDTMSFRPHAHTPVA